MQAKGETLTAGMENFYRHERGDSGRLTTPGSQYLLRLIKGGCLQDYSRAGRLKVLDVGCGSGFDLVTAHRLGWEPYGCEISESIVEHAREYTARFGCQPVIEVGDNQNLPFPDDFFDMLWSNNVIHYLVSEQAIDEAVAEYARVLKPGGRLFLLTNHPQNWILENAEPEGGNVFRLNCTSDFRNREALYVFQDQDHLRQKFSPHFSDLKIGMNQMEYFNKCLRNWVLTAVKP